MATILPEPPLAAGPRPDEDVIAELELKVAELAHRLKNLLAMVQAVAYQTLQEERPLADARDALDGRIAALGRAVDLFQHSFRERAELSDIIRASLTSEGRRYAASGPPCAVSSATAMSMVLIFQELECNAIKHGALSNGRGRIEVAWEIGGSGRAPALELSWRERGGPLVAEPQREGTGSKLTRRILARLGGSYVRRFPAEGLEWEMKVPVATLAR